MNFSFLKKYKENIEQKIQERNERHANIDDSDIRITYERVKLFFDPVVDRIIESITTVVNHVTGVHTIYLVGGFGGCSYIYSKLKYNFEDNYKFVTPDGRNYAVVKGAALMRKNPDFLSARRVDSTYGVSASITFEEGKHEEQYRIPSVLEGQVDMCSNIFATFVEKSDVVKAGYVYRMTFYPERQDQESMLVEIYSCSERDVWYTTGKNPSHLKFNSTWNDSQIIGDLTVPFSNVSPNDSEADRAVDVLFDFSNAEIKVSGYHRKSNTEVKVVLDFLKE